MGRHAAPRSARATTSGASGRSARSGRRKVVLAFAALGAAVLLVIGGQGTFAYWNDSATVTGGTFSSGTLDLTVDGAQGNPTAYAKTNLALASMVPGESVAETLSIANAGAADLTWIPSTSTGGGLGPALAVTYYLGGTASGDDTTYPRTESCTGGTQLTAGTTTTRLNKGAAAQTLCVQVTLPNNTDDSYQAKTTGSVTVGLAATQVIP